MNSVYIVINNAIMQNAISCDGSKSTKIKKNGSKVYHKAGLPTPSTWTQKGAAGDVIHELWKYVCYFWMRIGYLIMNDNPL